MFRKGAEWLSKRELIPTSLRAVLGYYTDSGIFDYRSITLKRRVDDRVDKMIRASFTDIEEAIAEEFGYGYVTFHYDTKLVLPTKLTLGYLYRTLNEDRYPEAEEMTCLIVEALIDGDMRDAINDEEYGDFEVDFETDEHDDAVIATIAQEVLQARVEEKMSSVPEAVSESYLSAVKHSERHQENDPYLRELLSRAQDGDQEAMSRIQKEYKHAVFDEQPQVFTQADLDLPYLKTQYARVGVIYSGMAGMYRGADLPVETSFERAIVLAIIGAQIWLDDVDDFSEDMDEGQLTPVTAEYVMADTNGQAKQSIIDISNRYLDRAKRQTVIAEFSLTAIAIEYISLDGNPSALPD